MPAWSTTHPVAVITIAVISAIALPALFWLSYGMDLRDIWSDPDERAAIKVLFTLWCVAWFLIAPLRWLVTLLRFIYLICTLTDPPDRRHNHSGGR